MSEWDLDLLGDPIPEGLGKRGRPPHLVTVQNRRKIIVLAAFDFGEEEMAAALSISVPTLRKHYFRELRSRRDARHRLVGKTLAALIDQVEKGNAAAMALMFKRLDKHELRQLGQMVADRGKPSKPLGKKEQQREAAGQVGGKYAPPDPPPMLMN